MLLRCRNADEVCWESDTPPFALQPFLQAEQGDIAPVQIVTEEARAEVEHKASQLWPKGMQYISDSKDARNRCTIFLTTPEAHVSRSLRIGETLHPAIPYTPAEYVINSNEVIKTLERTEYSYKSGMVGAFSIVCTDEASKLKNLGTKRPTTTKKHALKVAGNKPVFLSRYTERFNAQAVSC